VKDAQGDLVQGRTKWRRFAAVVLPAAAAAGAIVFGMANGAIAAQFAVSGQDFKVSADVLDGKNFVQYGGMVESSAPGADGKRVSKQVPVATSGIGYAELTNLCQSVKVPNVPVSLVIRAGRESGKPVKATNLLIDMTKLTGDATFTDINIGQDAGTLNGGHELNGAFGQRAEKVLITGLKQVAWSTSAGTFELIGLNLSVKTDFQGGKPEECFPDLKD
jgi:hypothetical protein